MCKKNVLIGVLLAMLLPSISVQADVVTYDFDDGTLQGWSNYEDVTEEYVVTEGGGNTPARSGTYVVVEAN